MFTIHSLTQFNTRRFFCFFFYTGAIDNCSTVCMDRPALQTLSETTHCRTLSPTRRPSDIADSFALLLVQRKLDQCQMS